MAIENFSLLTSQTLDTNDLTNYTANGDYDLYTSAKISNNNNLSALRLVIDYEDAVPASSQRNWEILCVIEGNNQEAGASERWFVLGNQFEPFRRDINGKTRIILVGKGVPSGEGVDDIVFVGTPVARISRVPAKLSKEFRVRLILREFGFGTSGAFQSVTLSLYGEKYDG